MSNYNFGTQLVRKGSGQLSKATTETQMQSFWSMMETTCKPFIEFRSTG